MVCISTQAELLKGFGLEKVDISHKSIVDKAVNSFHINLSDYTFANNYIWFENADGYISEINGNICLFINNNDSLTMLLPPLGTNKIASSIEECFKIMERFNKNENESKIDYVFADFLENIDFSLYEVERQNPDYIYLNNEITELRGNKYKTKRNEINYFTRNFNFEYKPYSYIYREHALELTYRWAELRLKSLNLTDPKDREHFIELISLERNAILRVLDQHEELGLKGAVILIDGKVEGMTFGEKINEKTASVLIEKTNFQYFGISQYLFKEFCLREFHECEFINVGDDLGFENLRKVKMSYHPYAYGPKYTIHKKTVCMPQA